MSVTVGLEATVIDQFFGDRPVGRRIRPQHRLDARQNIARWTDVKLAVNNAHDHLIAIIQVKLAAYVGRQL
jgi:hypothetical protein